MTAPETRPKPQSRDAVPQRRHSLSRRTLLFGVLAVAVVVAGLAAVRSNMSAPEPVAPPATPALLARGTVEPVAKATIATMNGGVVRALRVKVGETVEAGQAVATLASPSGMEVLVAPWRGTVLGLDARLGDTLMPGAPVAALGDLSHYQVETNDVDEYLIGQIEPNQPVTMTVDALDGRSLDGVVDTVALVQRTSPGGAVHYPVVIRLLSDDPGLRPGMTVRILFSPRGGA
ncbi:MAG: efflux RND transporter periplasmic adaptor subunit [Sphingomonadaceae bacterium]